MLARRASSNLLVRKSVSGVSAVGLVLTINSEEQLASWEAVESVAAGVTMIGENEMFVIALGIDDNDASRVFLISEFEAVWSELTAMLPIGLPAIEPFERWGVALAAEPGIVTLYDRPPPAIGR